MSRKIVLTVEESPCLGPEHIRVHVQSVDMHAAPDNLLEEIGQKIVDLVDDLVVERSAGYITLDCPGLTKHRLNKMESQLCEL